VEGAQVELADVDLELDRSPELECRLGPFEVSAVFVFGLVEEDLRRLLAGIVLIVLGVHDSRTRE
jgi:hypothetical protein